MCPSRWTTRTCFPSWPCASDHGPWRVIALTATASAARRLDEEHMTRSRGESRSTDNAGSRKVSLLCLSLPAGLELTRHSMAERRSANIHVSAVHRVYATCLVRQGQRQDGLCVGQCIGCGVSGMSRCILHCVRSLALSKRLQTALRFTEGARARPRLCICERTTVCFPRLSCPLAHLDMRAHAIKPIASSSPGRSAGRRCSPPHSQSPGSPALPFCGAPASPDRA